MKRREFIAGFGSHAAVAILKTCPLCRCGTMVVIETFEGTSSREPIADTS